MANNELSGPVLLNAILQYVKKITQILIILTDLYCYPKQSVQLPIFQNSKMN